MRTSRSATHDTIILGAGAAGLTAAAFAAGKGGSKGVLVLEGAKEAGKKILMSGGSRCNVLPAAIDVGRDYFTAQTATSAARGGRRAAATSHKALQRIFSTWSVEECRQWMEEEVGLELAMEEDTSKWFPRSNSAREVRDRLVAFALDKGVDLQYNQRITRLQRESSSGMWYCESEGGEQYCAPRVVVAMGGKSFPAVGTDGKGYQLAQELGHTIRPVYPALTPLTGPHPGGNQLAGVSLNVGVTAEAGPSGKLHTDAHRTGFLFTHRGYSGPSILDLSHHAVIDIEGLREAADDTRTTAITVNWCDMPEESWHGLFLSALAKGGSATRLVSNMLGERMPHRLALALCEEAGVAHQRMADLTKDKREQLIGLLTRYRLPYTGHQGYKKAEVTGGGVSLEEVKWETLESGIEANRGLFFCGEVLDCFGRIGGFNFYWAWVTGRLAGMSAASARLSSPSS